MKFDGEHYYARFWKKKTIAGHGVWVGASSGIIAGNTVRDSRFRDVVMDLVSELGRALGTRCSVGHTAFVLLEHGVATGVVTVGQAWHDTPDCILSAYVLPWRRRHGVLAQLVATVRLHCGKNIMVHEPSPDMKKALKKLNLETQFL